MSTWSISSKRLSRLKRSTWSSMCKPSAPMDSPSSSHSPWWLCKITEFSNDIIATSESAKKREIKIKGRKKVGTNKEMRNKAITMDNVMLGGAVRLVSVQVFCGQSSLLRLRVRGVLNLQVRCGAHIHP